MSNVIERWIPKANLPKLQKEVAALARRADRLGVQSLELQVGAESIMYVNDAGLAASVNKKNNSTIPVEGVEIRLVGESPQLNGWRFVAVIDHAENKNMVLTVPGETVPTRYRSAGSVCEHCRTNRDRNETFIVENESGKYTQVGSSCLADYLGHKSAEAMADWAADLAALFAEVETGEYDGSSGQSDLIDQLIFLALVADSISERGFHKKGGESGGTPTSLVALDAYMDRKKPSQKGIETAKKVVVWSDSIPDDTTNEYLYNVKAALSRAYIKPRATGILASAVSAYERDLSMRTERVSSQYFGTPGERTRVKLHLERVFSFDSQYGVSHSHIFRTPEGNIAVWKTGSQRLDTNKDYDFTCTIDSHAEYKGAKQTILKRCVEYVEKPAKAPRKVKGSPKENPTQSLVPVVAVVAVGVILGWVASRVLSK